MKTHIVVILGATLCWFSNCAMAQTSATERAGQKTMSFKVFKAPSGVRMTRAATLAQALDFANWPETKALFTAPTISKMLLKDPTAVTQSSQSCTRVPFGKTLWDDCKWSWRRLIDRKEAQATELSSEQRQQILAALSAEQRKDPQLVAAHLKRYLERYQKTRRYRLEGQIDLEVCLTPSNRAAKEFLLTKLTDNMLPLEGLVATYKNAKQQEGLGTINFVVQSRKGDIQQIIFVRNNVFVSIRANGFFVDAALPLAQKIDNKITMQPSSSMEDIQSHGITKGHL